MKKCICLLVLFFLLVFSGCAIVPARHNRGPHHPHHMNGPYMAPSFQIIVPPVRFVVPPGPVVIL